jgi:hypothetical protein
LPEPKSPKLSVQSHPEILSNRETVNLNTLSKKLNRFKEHVNCPITDIGYTQLNRFKEHVNCPITDIGYTQLNRFKEHVNCPITDIGYTQAVCL